MFVRKYDAGGSEVWTRQFGAASIRNDLARAVDADGNVYVPGELGGLLPGQTIRPDSRCVRAQVRRRRQRTLDPRVRHDSR